MLSLDWLSRFMLAWLAAAALFAACSTPASDGPQGGASGGGIFLHFDAGSCPDAAAEAASAGAAGENSTPCVPTLTRDYTNDVAPILLTCGGELCHGVFANPVGLAAQAIDVPAEECCSHPLIISPGHPELSYMLNKVRGEGMCAGVRMPRMGALLTAEQIQTLSDWICEGAPTE